MEITTRDVIVLIVAFISGGFSVWFFFSRFQLYSRTMFKILKDARRGIEYKLWKARNKEKSKQLINLLENKLSVVEENEKKNEQFDIIDVYARFWCELPKFKKKIFKKHHNV